MLHAHTIVVHGPCSPYTGPGMHVNDCLHCPATHRCPSCHKRMHRTLRTADVTHLTITEFDKA